jgi:hypothetical protein
MQETKMPRNKETQKRKLRSRLHPARGLIKKDCAVMVTTQKQQPTNNNREGEDPTIQNCVSSLLNVKQNRTEPEPYTAITISDSLFFFLGMRPLCSVARSLQGERKCKNELPITKTNANGNANKSLFKKDWSVDPEKSR